MRRSTRSHRLDLSLFDGEQVPGGCDHCNAFQILDGREDYRGGWHPTIHEDNCPTFRQGDR